MILEFLKQTSLRLDINSDLNPVPTFVCQKHSLILLQSEATFMWHLESSQPHVFQFQKISIHLHPFREYYPINSDRFQYLA